MEREDALFREKPNFYGEMLWVDGWLQGSGALAVSSSRGRETAAGWKKTGTSVDGQEWRRRQ